MNGITVDVAASSRVWTDGSRLAPVAKYRMEPIPRARTVSTRDRRGSVGWAPSPLRSVATPFIRFSDNKSWCRRSVRSLF